MLAGNETQKRKEYFKGYAERNRKHLSECQQHYYLRNKEKILKRTKEYQQLNEDRVKEQKKEYYLRVKDARKELVVCDCGASVQKCNLTEHKKTKKHIGQN